MAEMIHSKDAQEKCGENIQPTEVSPLLNSPNDNHQRTRLAGMYSTTVCVTSKAAFLTLFWSFFIGILYGLSSNLNEVWFPILKLEFISLVYIVNAISLCFYPLAGYLADNKIGKHKMISRSLQLLIIAVVVAIFIIIIFGLVIGIALLMNNMYWVVVTGLVGVMILAGLFYIAINVGFVGFNANVIQFGMEQLHDSPTNHQSLYIYWYVWIFYLVQILIQQPWSFLTFEFITSMVLFSVLGGSSFIMIALTLCVAHRNKKWFLINPARVNPNKLVNRITRFARHHKVPIRRSAFTYCEDEIPTGLDLAKTKYGGPYTTEEVENVKAFYGIIKILLSLGLVFFFDYASDPALFWYSGYGFLYERYVNQSFDGYGYYNNQKFAYQYFMSSNILSSLTVTVLIPVYIFIIKPLSCCPQFNMLKRIGLGIIFQILTLVSSTVFFSFITPRKHICIFQNYFGSNDDYVYYNYEAGIVYILPFAIILPRFLYGAANVFLYTALYEFICAQSPPSMKGLLIGLSFAIKGVFQAIGAAFIIPFSYIPTSIPSCGVLYYGINVLLAIFALIIFTYVARKYQYRQRDEICDVYRYAEEYYSNKQEEHNYD